MRRAAGTPAWLAAAGLVSLLGQVVLLREIVVASFGSELIYLLAMGVQMAGTAAGALTVRRAAVSEGRLLGAFASFAVALPLLAGTARLLRLMFRGVPGAFLPLPQQLAGVALVIVPAGFLGGLLFTFAARLHVERGGTLAKAYAIESAGSAGGGVLSAMLIAVGARNLDAAILCALLAAAACVTRRRWAWGLVALLAGALALAGRIDHAMTRLNHPDLLASRDTPYGRATVTGSFGQIAVFENDSLAFESEGTAAEEFVHLAALQVGHPRSVLVLGGAVEGLASEVAKHGPADVVGVEPDRRLVELASTWLPRAIEGRLHFEDPRRFLGRGGRYDLILSAMPEPDSGQASRFYTREFFATCARSLAPGGVLAFRLRSSENLWPPALARRNASIDGALRRSFRDVLVLPGSVNVVLATNGRLERDPDVLAQRFRERRIEARAVSPPWLRYVCTNDRVGEIERILANTAAVESSDGRPACYRYTLVLWLSRFLPSLATADPLPADTLHGAGALVLASLVLGAVTFLARRSESRRRTLLVAFAGFAGMVLEGTLILAYQLSRGVLYRDLGILLTVFMAGLSAGAWIVGRGEGRPRTGIVLMIATAAIATLGAWSASTASGGLFARSVLLAAAGFVTGSIFAVAASAPRGGESGSAVGPLYAADLAGGAAGSVLAGLLLVPVAGLPASMLLVAALSLAALLLAVPAK